MARLPLVSPIDRALFLKAQPYLDGLSPSILAALASYSEERFYSAGALIRAQDASIERILFLGSGEVEITRSNERDAQGLRIQAPGAVGLAHHFARVLQAPAVHAVVDTLCLEIATIDFDQIIEDHFALLLEIGRTSCEHAITNFKELRESRPPEVGFEARDRHETPVQLDLVHRLARARNAPFLQGTNLTVLGELIRFADPLTISVGTALWQGGDAIDRMVLVLDGGFRTEGEFGRCHAASGATLGAWEILADTARFEGWVAEEPSRILSIHRDLFTDLLEDHFEFAETYLRRVCQKIVDGWDAIELANRKANQPAEASW
jgi:CRP-like cAMP-binding protein